jgi:AraC-like DNA-binding protein
MNAARRRLRVLVVEDDTRVRSLVEDILESTADVDAASDPDEALRLLAAVPPRHYSLVIVDCLLPGPDGEISPRGVQLIGDIHARRPSLPILAITGASHVESIVVAAFRNGARDLLPKPFGVEDFRASVARLTLQPGPRLVTAPRTRDGIARVLTFLADHVGQSVSLGELARIAALSRSHLSRTFRGAVGIPLRAYVRNLRLDRAQQMLARSPGTSLTEVALEAGFYDLPHFDKAFRERYGVSPSEFLRRTAAHRAEPRRRRRRTA